MTNLNMYFRVGTLSAMALVLAACSGSSYPDLDKYMADVKARPAGHIQPIPAFTAYKSFAYSAAGLRNPFQPPVEVKEITRLQRLVKVKPDFNRPKEFLEQFNIDALTMVGTVQMEGTLWALVQDSENSVHRIKMGNYLGKNHGHVVELTENYVSVIEIVSNGPDEWVERPHKLPLKTVETKVK
ncbi:MAG: pilus assembly protein PilP [Verrucomicrobiaceae bacterium]|nr:pilus assembly protein PilP [Verrucomicrobiaceae bacterium]